VKTIILKEAQNKILDLFAIHKKIFIAYSGGVDSHVLLHLIAGLCNDKKDIKLSAIHVNHNINPQSLLWQQHCQKICRKLGVTCLVRTIPRELKANDHSIEEILRKMRYEIFAQVLSKDACLLTAHQVDDQAETLLLQLFRGAGPKGLAAMPEKVRFAKGFFARPLLKQKRAEILLYATKYELNWIEDTSNAEIKFDRNFIRHRLLPMIKEKWPSVITTLNRVSRHCSEANELLEILGELDLERRLTDKNIINVMSLKNLSLIRQKNVLRFWLQRLNLSLPSESKLLEVVRTVINSRYDKMPVVRWLGAEIRRFRSDLYAMPPLTPHDNKTILFFSKKILKLPDDLGVLKIEVVPKTKLDLKKFKVCFRQGGERIKLPGRKGHSDLKNLMQEWAIPPWLRDRIPLVYYDNELVAVVGYYSKLNTVIPKCFLTYNIP
jgi:tRNA(Ile)-lysidine synthase